MSFFTRILCFAGFVALSLSLSACSGTDFDKFGLGVFGDDSEAEAADDAAAAEPAVAAQPVPTALPDRPAVQGAAPKPVYIVGEVESPGEFPFSDGMTVPQLVILAGGYSHRADPDRALVTRKGVEAKMYMDLSDPVPIKPGDIIQIPQKYF